MSRLFIIACGMFFFGLQADEKSVSLNLKAVVDATLKIKRIDDIGDIDVFKNNVPRFKVFYNGVKSVDVKFISDNDWSLHEKNDSNKKIRYSGFVDDEVIGDNHKVVSCSQFNDGAYMFDLKFELEEKNYDSGEYSDKITVAVAEMDS